MRGILPNALLLITCGHLPSSRTLRTLQHWRGFAGCDPPKPHLHPTYLFIYQIFIIKRVQGCDLQESLTRISENTNVLFFVSR